MTPTPDVPSTNVPSPYTTSDTPYAAYLHYKGHKIVTTKQDPNDYKREVMVFVLDDEVPQLEEEWRSGQATGDLKLYYRSYKIVSRMVNESRKSR